MKKLVCHGDSLTEGADIERQYRWPSIIANTLNLDVRNTGIGGDSTAGMLARFYPDVVRHKPDFVMITGGTNDLYMSLDDRQVLSNIYSMVVQSRYHDITPIIGLPLPIDVQRASAEDTGPLDCSYPQLVDQLARTVERIAKLADDNDVARVDFYHLFFDDGEKIRQDLFLEDGFHVNRAGHRLMGEAAVGCLKRAFGFGQ